MDILVYDGYTRLVFDTAEKKTFPKNEYKALLHGAEIYIVASGDTIPSEKILSIDDVGTITDNQTGGAGVVATPATITLLFDLIEPYFFNSSGGAGSGGATEATLSAVLASIKDTQDLEIKLVRDTGDSDVVVQQVREYDQDTKLWTTTFEKVDGTTHTVIGPLEYLDASAVLNLIYTELQVKADPTESQLVGLPTGTETPTQETFVSSAGSPVTAGKVKVSVMNIGTTDATVLGNTLEPGISVSFVATEGKTLGAIAYTASATAILKIVTIS